MISVDKYIRKLIYEQNCVIIPGFGGIMTHYVHSQYNEDLREYSPSRKKIAFNEVLKQDDGLLVHTLIRYEKVDRSLAVEAIRQYVKQLSSKVALEGKVEIEGVGFFSQNGEGSLVFEPLKDVSFETDWFGFSEITAKRINAVTVSRGIEQVDEAISTNYAEQNAEDMIVLGATKRTGWMRWTAAAVAVGAITYLSTIYGSVSSSTTLSSLNPLTALLESMEPKRDTYAAKESDKKDVSEYDFADSLIREINGMAHPGSEETAIVNQDDTTTATSVPEELVVVKEEIKPEVVATPEVVEVKKEIQPVVSKKFHLVAGSFSTEKTAMKLVTELREKGFSDAVTLEHKGKELVKVSAKSYMSMNEAYKGRADLEKVVGSGVWVFRDR